MYYQKTHTHTNTHLDVMVRKFDRVCWLNYIRFFKFYPICLLVYAYIQNRTSAKKNKIIIPDYVFKASSSCSVLSLYYCWLSLLLKWSSHHERRKLFFHLMAWMCSNDNKTCALLSFCYTSYVCMDFEIFCRFLINPYINGCSNLVLFCHPWFIPGNRHEIPSYILDTYKRQGIILFRKLTHIFEINFYRQNDSLISA